MKQALSFLALLLFSTTGGAPAAPSLTANDLAGKRVVLLGDSITQNGTYVSQFHYLLLKANPDLDFDLISVGLSSETASGLSEEDHPFPRPCIHTRLDEVLTGTRPKVLVACYGMNDGIYHPASPHRDEAYQKGLLKLVAEAKAAGVEKIILLSPGTFEGKKTFTEGPHGYKRPHAAYDEVLAGYAEWLRSLSLPDVVTIDLHTPMSTFAEKKRADDPSFVLSRDGIHPQELGHFLMARAVAQAIGLATGDDPEAALAELKADPLYPLVHRHRATRSKAWLPYLGYTRGKTFKTDSVAEAEARAAALMKEINELRRK